jgi:hypothetical protein
MDGRRHGAVYVVDLEWLGTNPVFPCAAAVPPSAPKRPRGVVPVPAIRRSGRPGGLFLSRLQNSSVCSDGLPGTGSERWYASVPWPTVPAPPPSERARPRGGTLLGTLVSPGGAPYRRDGTWEPVAAGKRPFRRAVGVGLRVVPGLFPRNGYVVPAGTGRRSRRARETRRRRAPWPVPSAVPSPVHTGGTVTYL